MNASRLIFFALANEYPSFRFAEVDMHTSWLQTVLKDKSQLPGFKLYYHNHIVGEMSGWQEQRLRSLIESNIPRTSTQVNAALDESTAAKEAARQASIEVKAKLAAKIKSKQTAEVSPVSTVVELKNVVDFADFICKERTIVCFVINE